MWAQTYVCVYYGTWSWHHILWLHELFIVQIRVYIIFVLRHEVMFLGIGSRVNSNYERLTSSVVCQLPNRVPEPHATPPPTATTHPSKTNWQYPYHDDVVRWKHFPRCWPFVRGIHRSPVNSPHKGQWRGALMFSLMCAWINGWVNNREAGDLRCHRVHCDVTVMWYHTPSASLQP